VSLYEDPLEVVILALGEVISDVVEEFALLLEDLVLEPAGEEVVLGIVEDVHLGLRTDTSLQLLEEVVLATGLLELLKELLGHTETALFNSLILLDILPVLCEEWILINGFTLPLAADSALVNILLVYVLGHVRVYLLVKVLRLLPLLLLLHSLGSGHSDLPLLLRIPSSTCRLDWLLDQLLLDVLGHLRFRQGLWSTF